MKNFVIIGGGTAGWIAAAILSNLVKHINGRITLIESPDIPTIGVGEATIPSIIDMLDYLNISQEDFILKTDATFKLGIKFVDWKCLGHHYWHPFGTIGGKIDTLPFYHHWRKYRDQGGTAAFTNFSPAIAMAKGNRFFIPNPKTPSLFSASAHALHFDASKVAGYLQTFACNNGVKHISANVRDVQLKESGLIKSVSLDNGKVIDGDFFIDCTGQRGLLIGKALGVKYLNWQKYLPVDRAIAVQTENTGEPPPYTESTAHEHGWRWRIPLQTRTGNGYVYCSDYCDDETASALLEQHVQGAMITEPRVIRFTTGKREKMWFKNCLAVGLSSGFLEPLESTSIYLIMKAMLNFVQMLPVQELAQATTDEFNRLMDIEYECIRDFIILHYCETERSDTPFWRWWQETPIPESLEQKLALFKAQGRLMRNDLDLFGADSWYAVLEGMGVTPEGQDPLVDISALAKVEDMLAQRLELLKQEAAKVPLHFQFIKAIHKNHS